jgi:hypothetical protein
MIPPRGLDKEARLAEERERRRLLAERDAPKAAAALSPPYPWPVEPFDPGFFGCVPLPVDTPAPGNG